jgi:predicted permease
MTRFDSLIARVRRRAATLFHLEQRERDMDEEMRFHILMEARELTRDGLPPNEAEREARLKFGGVERHKEDARDASGVRLLEDLGQDLRYAVRQCRANPSFTLATLLTLSLGIGASTVMYAFTQLDAVPFERSDRLVYIRQYSKKGCPGCQNIAAGNALMLAAGSRTLESVSLMAGWTPAFRGRQQSEVLRAQKVTHEYFRTVGVRPLIGRTFLPTDTLATQTPVAVISEPMWRTRFGADSSIVGGDIVLDGTHYTVRGVIPAGYEYPERTDAWTIRTLTADEANEHASILNFQAIGRLRDGARLEQAAAEAEAISERIALAFPDAFREWALQVRPLSAYNAYGDGRTTAVFLTAVGFVLLNSCINLAGLLIARLTRRRRELAVRSAMGAHASRIARQLLTETVLVCLVAGVLGLAFARGGLTVIVNALPESAAPAGWTRLRLDWGAFAFALGLGSVAGIAIGLWPSIRFSRPELNRELRDSARTASTGGVSGGERVRRALVVAELAMSLVLVTAAGLLVRTISNIAKAPVGFSSDHVLTMGLQLPAEIDGKRVESRGYFDRLAEEVARVPGVKSAGAVAFLPLSRSGFAAGMFQVEGRPALKGSGGTRTQFVTPGYFAAFKIPLLRGRALTDADADTAHGVALINETLSRKFFADDNPLGRVLVLYSGTRMTVVGVVGDVKQQGATSGAGQEILIPAATVSRRTMNLVVRTALDPAALSLDVAKAVAHYDPNLAIHRVRTMDTVVDEFLGPFRVERMLMVGLATIALVIATMGMYAIVSYTVASRTKEFGVRLALGATGSSLLGLVLGQGLRLVGIGVAIGLVGAVAATRLMASMLFGVPPGDPVTIAAACVGSCAVALVAALVPARRALLVDPVRSLREE